MVHSCKLGFLSWQSSFFFTVETVIVLQIGYKLQKHVIGAMRVQFIAEMFVI